MGENPWIKWSGGPQPVAYGVIVDVRFFDGDELFGVPAGIDGEWKTAFGEIGCALDWEPQSIFAARGFPEGAIVAYRLHDDGSEAKTREARLEQFRKIANDALIGDKPVKAPKKESV